MLIKTGLQHRSSIVGWILRVTVQNLATLDVVERLVDESSREVQNRSGLPVYLYSNDEMRLIQMSL